MSDEIAAKRDAVEMLTLYCPGMQCVRTITPGETSRKVHVSGCPAAAALDAYAEAVRADAVAEYFAGIVSSDGVFLQCGKCGWRADTTEEKAVFPCNDGCRLDKNKFGNSE